MIIIAIVGLCVAFAIDKLHRNLDAIQKDTRAMIDDLKAIAESIEETNRLLDDMEIRMLERIDNIDETKRRY